MATIYRKTAKGQREIETRALKLAPRFRNLLILVDGRRCDDDLAALVPNGGLEAVQALAAGGFIEAIGLVASSGAGRDEPQAAFQRRRRDAVHRLIELAGPDAEPLAMEMAKAQQPGALNALLPAAGEAVAAVRGEATATEFLMRFGA